METKENQFFYENEVAVTKNIIKVVRWLILAFPALMFFSLIGLFRAQMSELLVMSAIGLVVTMGPTVAYKMGDQLYFSCHIHVFQIFWCCTDRAEWSVKMVCRS